MNLPRQKKGGILRLVILVAIVVVVSTLVVHFLLDWRAGRQWKEAQARMEKEGLLLDWRAMMPPPLAKELNFAAIEPLMGFNVINPSDDPTDKASESRQALLDLDKGLERCLVRANGVMLGQPPDWSEVVQAMTASKFLEQSLSMEDAAGVILRTLDEKKPLLKQITSQSFQYSDAEFLPTWREQNLSEPLSTIKTLPHSAWVNLNRVLFLHGMAASEAGDSIAALADARTQILLSKALLRDSSNTGPILASVVLGQSCEILWNLCRHRGLPEDQLASLQVLLSSINQEDHFLRFLSINMVENLEIVDVIADHPEARPAFFKMSSVGGALSWSKISPILPRWFFVLNKSHLVEIEMDYVFMPFKESGFAGVIKNQKALNSLLVAHREEWKHLDLFFAREMIPQASNVVNKFIHLECSLRQAIVACALERFYLKYQRYPDKLEQLLPDFLTAVPIDPMDHLPIRYSQSASDRYQLWCVGLDGLDDGGQVNSSSTSSPVLSTSSSINNPWLHSIQYKGDRIWQYTPVKTDEPDSRNRKWVAPSAGGLPPLPSSSRQ